MLVEGKARGIFNHVMNKAQTNLNSYILRWYTMYYAKHVLIIEIQYNFLGKYIHHEKCYKSNKMCLSLKILAFGG